MMFNDKLSASKLKDIIGEKSKEWQFSKAVGKGLQGNTTYCIIKDALDGYANKEDLLKFDIHLTDGNLVNTETGELSKIVDVSFEQEPLYKLWHVLYSISDIEELKSVLRTKFKIDNV